MPTNEELNWAAGFLEGEGCFQAHHGSTATTATQTETREPLDKLLKLFGGSIILITPKAMRTKGSKVRNYWRWSVYGAPAVITMIHLYPFMSVRRQEQIALALEGVLNSKVKYHHKDTAYDAVTEFVSRTQKVS